MRVTISPASCDHGSGVREVIYVSGCDRFCKGCNAKENNFLYGTLFDGSIMRTILDKENISDAIEGITITGGEPMIYPDEVLFIIMKFRQDYPWKNIWLYTGYTWEEMIADPKMKRIAYNCDVIVDGKYIEKQKDLTYSYKGSYNQRIIDVAYTLAYKSITTWNPTED